MGSEYHKIQSIFKRDHKGNFLEDKWTCPEFEYLASAQWEGTEKVDGTNIRVSWHGRELEYRDRFIQFAGRTDRAQLPVPLYDRLAALFGTGNTRYRENPHDEAWYEVFGEDCRDDVTLYGEGYGAGIQKGGGNYIPDGVDFVLFDVKIGDWWLKREDVEDIADHFGSISPIGVPLRVAPVIFRGTLHQAILDCEAGFNSTWGDFEAEGYVLRPNVELRTRRGDRIITKIKCRDFK